MSSTLVHRFLAGEGPHEAERRELLQTARRLGAAARSGHMPHILKGCHVAVAAAPGADLAPRYFEDAAIALGAHVSHITEDALQAACANPEWARMLGRLYDAVDCGRLDREAAIGLERAAGIPMFSGLGDEGHPVRQLLAELGGEGASGADASREALLELVEAVLVATVS
jgi:ornithine carbamoyltransferase